MVTPPSIKTAAEIVSSIHKWEAKVALLQSQYGEKIEGRLRMAIVLSMLPKEFQDMVLQTHSGMKEVTYGEVRDYVVSVAQQKAQMRKPMPLEVGAMDTYMYCQPCEDGGYWYNGWEPDLDVVDRSGIKCYAYGQMGHMARNCVQKGKGKGKDGDAWGKGKDGGG